MKSTWALSILIVFFGCKTAGSGAESFSDYASYQEDINASLPQYEDFRSMKSVSEDFLLLESGQAVDDQLVIFTKRLREKNQGELYFSGYTILVFSGIDRNQAFNIRDEIALNFPDLPTEMQYQEPRYLIKVGRYGYKFEAQKNFSMIKAQFPTSRIIQDRFLRKETTVK